MPKLHPNRDVPDALDRDAAPGKMARSARQQKTQQGAVQRRYVWAGPDRTGASTATDEPVHPETEGSAQDDQEGGTNQH